LRQGKKSKNKKKRPRGHFGKTTRGERPSVGWGKKKKKEGKRGSSLKGVDPAGNNVTLKTDFHREGNRKVKDSWWPIGGKKPFRGQKKAGGRIPSTQKPRRAKVKRGERRPSGSENKNLETKSRSQKRLKRN